MRWIHVDDSKLGMKDAVEIPFRLVSIWWSYNVSNIQDLQLDFYNEDFNIEPSSEQYSIAA